MHHFYIRYLGLFFLILSNVAQAGIPARPEVQHLVNDFAQILPNNEEEILEQRLIEYDTATSTQISIITVSSLEGQDISAVAYDIGEQWGIGRKDKNNGILILIAPNERKVFIATGYGIESILSDALCRRIIEQNLKPFFKENQYIKGINNGVDIIQQHLSGEFASTKKNENAPPLLFILFLIGLFIVFIIIISISKKNGYTYSGRGINHTATNTIGMLLLGRGFGGGSSFGGFGGGSFGGFGGGSFGGGGAGGSW